MSMAASRGLSIICQDPRDNFTSTFVTDCGPSSVNAKICHVTIIMHDFVFNLFFEINLIVGKVQPIY